MRTSVMLTALAVLTLASIANADATNVISRGGTPWIVSASVPVGAASETTARAALATLAPASRGATLVRTNVDHFGDGDTIVRFEQTHLGLPVIGRGATVRIDAHGVARMAVVDVEHDLPSSSAPTIAAAVAASTAGARTRLGVTDRDAHLVIMSTPEGGRLAWVVLPKVPTGFPTAPRIIVDARTGEVLEARDLAVFLNLASVYDTNPIASPQLATRDLAIAPNDMAGHLSSAWVMSNNCLDMKTVKSVSFGGFMLPMHVCDLVQTAQADMGGDFLYAPNDNPSDTASRSDTFSEVSMYFHATKVYQFFRTLQGDPNAQVVVDKPLRAISNLQLPTGITKGDFASAGNPNLPLDPFQNAFFSPAGGQLGAIFQTLYGFNAGAMWFGQGPERDYSYDGDVVYHEFTHAVVDQTLKLQAWHGDKYGAIDSPGAMNEGLADYFSSALTGDPKVGEYAAGDISAALKDGIRNIDNKDTCLDTIVGEVHFDSTFFSGGLWSARQSLPQGDREKYDAAIYKAMRSNAGKGDLGYEDAVNLFLAVLKADLPSGATALETEMTQKRGILPICDRTYTYAGKALHPTKVDIRSPGYWAGPGKQNFVGAPVIAPGMLQVKLPFDVPAQSVAITFKSPVPAGGVSMFMNMGTKFTPKLLVKFDAPLTWTTKGKVTSDADVTVDCVGDMDKSIQTYTATFDVPEGATFATLQIGNAGDQDGTYGDITLDVTPLPVPADAGTDSGTGPQKVAAGCSCDAPGSGSVPGPLGAVVGLGLVGLLAARRRRSSR
jgi:MYXO-CTERM domain-containing protein